MTPSRSVRFRYHCGVACGPGSSRPWPPQSWCLIGMTWFARVVIRSERESFARAERHEASANFVDTISGTSLEPAAAAVAVSADDRDAQRAARDALSAARKIAAGPTAFVEAGPRQLANATRGLTFTDGPVARPLGGERRRDGERLGRGRDVERRTMLLHPCRDRGRRHVRRPPSWTARASPRSKPPVAPGSRRPVRASRGAGLDSRLTEATHTSARPAEGRVRP